MSKPEHNDKNIELLAGEITDNMDMAVLVQYFYEGQYDYYESNKKAFETDWQDQFGDEDEEE